MYQGSRILAVIPARGGSKGIKNKNIVDLCGKPLIAYTIESARKCEYIDRIIVSTDSEEIAMVARQYGADVPFMRPAEYAQDQSTTLEVILHVLKELDNRNERYDILILLQPTQPLRTSEDIDHALQVFFENNRDPLVSISEVDDHPILIRSVGEDNRLIKLLQTGSTCRRQDMPPFYRVNGCIYINNVCEINETTSFNDNMVPFIMDRKHSVDIDEETDLLYASLLINHTMEETK